jgi:Recombination endonuclease VII
MQRLKVSEIAVVRGRLSTEQGGLCALCKLPLTRPCLDHDHSTGAVRGVLHSGCNALLGKVENNAARYGVTNISAFGSGVGAYLQRHQTNLTGLLHPTHKTDDEKRLLRNSRAVKARATKKATA